MDTLHELEGQLKRVSPRSIDASLFSASFPLFYSATSLTYPLGVIPSNLLICILFTAAPLPQPVPRSALNPHAEEHARAAELEELIKREQMEIFALEQLKVEKEAEVSLPPAVSSPRPKRGAEAIADLHPIPRLLSDTSLYRNPPRTSQAPCTHPQALTLTRLPRSRSLRLLHRRPFRQILTP